jgi:hypothetical protein
MESASLHKGSPVSVAVRPAAALTASGGEGGEGGEGEGEGGTVSVVRLNGVDVAARMHWITPPCPAVPDPTDLLLAAPPSSSPGGGTAGPPPAPKAVPGGGGGGAAAAAAGGGGGGGGGGGASSATVLLTTATVTGVEAWVGWVQSCTIYRAVLYIEVRLYYSNAATCTCSLYSIVQLKH